MGGLRKTRGISYAIWYGSIEVSDRKLASYKIWLDYYNCNLTPEDAILKIKE